MSNNHAKHYEMWTRKEFEALPELGRWKGETESPTEVDCLIIMPTRKLHDSGYRIIDIVVIKDEEPIGKFSNMTDVLQIVRSNETPRTWSMDWLRVSGLMRIWAAGYDCQIISPFSAFEISAIKINK